MATQVDRPYLDREATVFGVDHNWRPDRALERAHARVRQRHRAGRRRARSDTGATVWADYEMDHGWRQQWIAMHFGNELQINDAGYLSRNSTNYLHWQVNRRFTDLPEESRYSSKDWRWRVSTDYNDHGQLLGPPVPHEPREPAAQRQLRVRRRSTSTAPASTTCSRAATACSELPPNFNSYFDYERPRKGNWAYEVEAGTATAAGSRATARWATAVELRAHLLHQRRVQRVRRRVWRPQRRTGWSGSTTT